MSRTPQLDEAVAHALRAPSVHNTQPWRWRIDPADGVVEGWSRGGRGCSRAVRRPRQAALGHRPGPAVTC